MQPREYQFQALRDALTAFTAQYGVELHIGGFFEYADCNSSLLRLLSDYIVHENPYCLYVKTNPNLWRECIYLKRQILHKLEAHKGPFYGVCHCGVGEYVSPIYCHDRVAGYVSIGCFPPDSNKLDRRFRSISRRYGFSEERLRSSYAQHVCPKDPPNALLAAVDTLALLLSCLLDDVQLGNLELSSGQTQQQIILQRAMEYLHTRYIRSITMDDLAQFCKYSKSHLQHLFRKQYGTTITAYLEALRMEKARTLLQNSELSIQQIAHRVGYRDPNYFTAVFSKSHGTSPTAFRQRHNTNSRS